MNEHKISSDKRQSGAISRQNLVGLVLCAGLLAGCAHQRAKNASEDADPLANLPPHLEQYAKTPEGRRALETVRKWKEQADRTKHALLHKTDHPAVLSASREVIRKRRDYKRDPKWHGPNNPEVSLIAANDPQLPTAIRELKAASIFAYDDNLQIEFGGGFHHQGFIAYAESVTNAPARREGFQRLIEGLWFYEDTR